MMTTTSFPKHKIRVLLLENIHEAAADLFSRQEFQVDLLKKALSEAELCERLQGVDLLGIRSKTRLTETALQAGRQLLGVGAFCIGTNQVHLGAANALGVPVFNAPFSNTRSVAEMILGEIIILSRQLGDRSREVHTGRWRKAAVGCHEVRGKTLGIVGYGHIGSQVGVLAEALGMQVRFYDIASKLAIGNCQPVHTLQELLPLADFLTLHVPETPQTRGMMGAAEIAFMKPGAILLNASRGTVVGIDALAAALREGRLGGAAVDVFPEEPEGNAEDFKSPLQLLPNVMLTPHVGGSTEEAQENIGREVAVSLIKFVNEGTTTGAVNFPHVELPPTRGTHRVLNAHRNVPGVLRDINRIVSDLNANIHSQLLATDPHIGYLIMDLDQDVSQKVRDGIAGLSTSIKTRILY
jgi:D-3-phosphoglycerate dehydrogenase / 2-oxoglutarate reductase